MSSGELARVPREALAALSDPDSAEVTLERCADLGAVRRICQAYQAVARTDELRRAYAEMSGLDAWKVRRNAQEAALWAGRRLGELLELARLDASKGVAPVAHDEQLAEVPKISQRRCRQLAAVPIEVWRERLAQWRAEGVEPTAVGLRRLAPTTRTAAPALAERRAVEVRIGRLLRLAAQLPPEDVRDVDARGAAEDEEQLLVEAVDVYARLDPAYRAHVRALAEGASGKLAALFERRPELLT